MKIKRHITFGWLPFLMIISIIFQSNFASSEIVTDGTVGPAEKLAGPDYQIDSGYGTQTGGNLFHSFTRFDINKGESATFNGPNTVDNVISRVTGGFESQIDGLIQSEMPGANLYFLNPAGFFFGPNASIDVGGSFHVSTADYMAFPDGSIYSAANPEGSSFSSAPPSAFGFIKEDPASITFQGSGSEYATDELGYHGIQVAEGETFSVIGGDIRMTSGDLDEDHRVESRIEAPGGKINLVSSASPGEVTLDHSDLKMDGISEKGDITIDNGSLASVTSDGAGHILIRSGNLSIDNGNASELSTWGTSLNANARGDVDGGGIDVKVDHKVSLTNGAGIYSNGSGNSHGRSILIDASDIDISGGSFLVSGADQNGTGADIAISANNTFRLADSDSVIYIASFGNAEGGNSSIDAGSIIIDDYAYIHSEVWDSGNGGKITMNADSVTLNNGAYVMTSGTGIGTVGDIEVQADSIKLLAGDKFEADNICNIRSMNFSSGKSGNIVLEASDSILLDGRSGYPSSIHTTSFNGESGDVHIITPELTLQNSSTIDIYTYEGQTGDVEIYTDRLKVNGGQISTSVWGPIPDDLYNQLIDSGFDVSPPAKPPKAGSITVEASDSIVLEGQISWKEQIAREESFPFKVSQINAIANVDGISGGKITIKTDELYLGKGGSIGALSDHTGVSGSVNIDSKNIELKNGSFITAGTFNDTAGGQIDIQTSGTMEIGGFISTWSNGGGEGGQIQLKTPSLSIVDGGALVCRAESKGDGGDIIIDSENISITEGSRIDTSSTEGSGNAGNIYIDTDTLSAHGSSLIRSDAIEADGGNIDIGVDRLMYLRNSYIATRVKGGDGSGGNIRVEDPEFLVMNDAYITANAYGGNGGNISIAADQIVYTPDSGVSASSELGIDGQISIDATFEDISRDISALPTELGDPADLMRSPCANRTGEEISTLIARGRKGTPRPLDDWQPCPVPTFDAFHTLDGFSPSTRQAMLSAETLYQRGLFDEAITLWEKHLQLADQNGGKANPHVHLLLYSASAYSEIGHYDQAEVLLHQALSALDSSPDIKIEVLTHIFLSDLYLSLKNYDRSLEHLTKAEEKADTLKKGYIYPALINADGNVNASRGDFRTALTLYESAIDHIGDNPDDARLRSAVRLNHIRAQMAVESFDKEVLISLVEKAGDAIEFMPMSHWKAADAIGLALLSIKIRDRFNINSAQLTRLARQYLTLSERIAKKIGDKRMASYAQGVMAGLLEERRRFAEAMVLNQKAILNAQQCHSPELFYQWQWQAGRVERAMGHTEKAISWYQMAVDTLSDIQGELHIGYRGDWDVFNERIKPVYLDLADMLITQSEGADTDNERMDKLKSGLRVIEIMKTAEVQNYYQDECVTQTQSDSNFLDRVPAGSAVLYPILFPDRLSLIIMLQDTVTEVNVPVDALTVKQSAERFRYRLQRYENPGRVKFYGRQLYEWLIHPITRYLEVHQVETLVVAPDGALRLIPFAALHDGRNFLAEKYAIVTIPGISLSKSAVGSSSFDVLSGGLSVSKHGFVALPHVSDELSSIEDLVGGVILENQGYTRSNLEKELEMTNYDILHLATHGVFDGNYRESYLLAYDGRITVDALSSLVGLGKFREDPLELLTLSACQTGIGDEQAALGLAGIALKAGARSTMATLWSINDEATSILIREFYESLSQGKTSKAKALQQAQKRLIDHPRFSHPAYWSSFILIGEW